MSQKSSMPVGRESDDRVLPAKRLNRDEQPSAEGAEERRSAKENSGLTWKSLPQFFRSRFLATRRLVDLPQIATSLETRFKSCGISRPILRRSRVSGSYNHPKGVDGAKIAALWRTPTRSSDKPSHITAFSRDSAAEWTWCTRPRTGDLTDLLH